MISVADPIPDLVDFVSNWVGDVEPCHRIRKSELPHWIPPPLREIYHRFGRYPPTKGRKREAKNWVPLFSTQDFLIPPNALKLDEQGRFSFVHENQGVFLASTNPSESDPPVWFQFDEADPWQIAEQRLSRFLTTFCLQEIVLGAPYLASVNSTKISGVQELTRRRYKKIWTNARWLKSEYRYSYFIVSENVMIFRQHGDYYIASNHSNYLDVLKDGVEVFEHGDESHFPAYLLTRYK